MRPFLTTLFGALALIGLSSGISLDEAEIVGNVGDDETTPIPGGDDFTLRCALTVGDQEAWHSCSWEHIVEDYDGCSNNVDCVVKCSAGNSDSGNTACNNLGGSTALNSYASRITMDTGSSYCGIRVSDADAYDNGYWECIVFDGHTSQSSQVEVWVANMSTLYITDPDLEDDSSLTIVYDLSDERREIEATCSAYGAIPEPTFHWYLDDDRNEIDESDPNFKTSDKEGEDRLGSYYRQTMTWEPTIDDLCDNYDLDQEVCNQNKKKYRNFEMNLICKVEQEGGYFESENDNMEAVVVIEVTDSATNVLVSTSTLLLSIVFALSRQ